MSFSETMLLISATHGFLLTVFIYKRAWGLRANHFLFYLALFYSILLLNLCLWDLGLYRDYPVYFILLFGFQYLIPSLHYLYIVSIIESALNYKDILKHCIPFIVIKIVIFISYFITGAVEILYSGNTSLFLNMSMFLLGFAYSVSSLKLTMQYKRTVLDNVSDTGKLKIDWLHKITLFTVLIWCVYFFESMIALFGLIIYPDFLVSSLALSIYVFVLVYNGLLKSHIIFSVSELIHESSEEKSKYRKSGLKPELLEKYLTALINSMEEKELYRDNELTLKDLSENISIAPYYISEILNMKLNKNFYDFVNEYRVKQVKKDLRNPKKDNYTILALALEAGFNSKTSFNTVFKKFTGLTPSQFKKNR